MSAWKGRVLSALVLLLLLGIRASAQLPPLVRAVAVPGRGVELLVTRVDVEAAVARTELLAPGATAAAGTALPTDYAPQVFITRYADVFGLMHQLITLEEAGESAEAHALRHAAALAELVAQFPPGAGAPPAPASLEPGQQILKTSWEGADGLDHEVQTARKINETTEKWAQRHAEGVAAMIALFPPKPGFAVGDRGLVPQTICSPGTAVRRLRRMAVTPVAKPSAGRVLDPRRPVIPA